MTQEEIQAYPIAPRPAPDADRKAIARERMKKTGQWNSRQQLGNRLAIGCVALEITQRCNLDCTCCYLSEHSEAVKDLPLAEIFRRIEMIADYYGPGTAVQVTGGDPTLRKLDDMLAILRRLREKKLRPTLFTNGIKATRPYLEQLAAAGLADVAFHVDLTQERKGYKTEVDLNEIRQEYIENARGLGISVFFNYTVTRENFHEIPEIVRFYARNADVVKTASFQLQADTGRGVDRERGALISQESVIEQINAGADADICFDMSPTGHASCNKYGMCLEVNGRLYNALDDSDFIERVLSADDVEWDQYTDTPVRAALRWLREHPGDLWRGATYIGRMAWNARADLIAARGKVNRISFFLHNFMDACSLEKDRIDACSFFTITRDGPVSMCLANAKRDDYILLPIEIPGPEGEKKFWEPLTGDTREVAAEPGQVDPTSHSIKHLKGRSRQIVASRRAAEKAEAEAKRRARSASGSA